MAESIETDSAKLIDGEWYWIHIKIMGWIDIPFYWDGKHRDFRAPNGSYHELYEIDKLQPISSPEID